MAISKLFGWVSFAAAISGIAWIAFSVTRWTVEDPRFDPLMEALKLFFGPLWWILFLAVSFFIASKAFKWAED
jgi:predicted MFS family arabinose efflux permease